MAATLGKRKRRDEIENTDLPPQHEEPEEMQALFRQHFEAIFEPLQENQPPPVERQAARSVDTNEASDSDWDGLSDEVGEQAEIVHHTMPQAPNLQIPKEELKMFMTTRPPDSSDREAFTTRRSQPGPINDDEANTDAANLKKDIALQRLLKESHLLDPQSSLVHSGRNRHKALDLRLQDLGSKSSIFRQKNMPLIQRKGIAAKATGREEKRRREAQENGIVLERATSTRKKGEKRQRGVGAPSVGKFQGGMLRLSKNDVAQIEGPRKRARGRR